MSPHLRAHGIVLVLIGIVVGMQGMLRWQMLRTSRSLMFAGVAITIVGLVLAIVGRQRRRGPRAVPPGSLPEARLHRRR